MDIPKSLAYIKLYVSGPTHDSYIDILGEKAKEVEEDGTIVDIGTCEGRTAFAMAVCSKPSVKVYTIDPTPNLRFYEHRKKLGVEAKIEIIEKRSQDINWGIPIDLLFHDGLHTYYGVKDDIEKYCPFVKKDSWIIFDDYPNYKNTIGKAVDEYEGKFYQLDHYDNLMYCAKKI